MDQCWPGSPNCMCSCIYCMYASLKILKQAKRLKITLNRPMCSCRKSSKN